jgi:hypothetical protein
LGLGIDNPFRMVFWVCGRTSACRGLMTGIFGILESSAMQWYQGVAPTQELISHCRIHNLWAWGGVCKAWNWPAFLDSHAAENY